MFARSFTRIARRAAPVRKMGGGHAPAAPKEGFEGAVRKIIPEDHYLALAIIGFYSTLFLVSKAWPSKKKPVAVEAAAPVAAPVTASASGDDIPSIESPEFGDWISAPGNIEKLIARIP